MPVQGSMGSLTAVAASNSPPGTESISNNLDDYLRSISAILRHTEAKGATLTAAASLSTVAATGAYVPITGATAITHLGTGEAGLIRDLLFLDAGQINPSANVILPASATIVTAAGDVARFRSEGAGAWRMTNYLVAAAAYDGGLSALQAGIDAVSASVAAVQSDVDKLTAWTTVQTASSTYATSSSGNYICDPDAGEIVMELPAGAAGALLRFKTTHNCDATNYVRLKPDGAEVIAGQTGGDTLDVDKPYVELNLVYDATLGWVI